MRRYANQGSCRWLASPIRGAPRSELLGTGAHSRLLVDFSYGCGQAAVSRSLSAAQPVVVALFRSAPRSGTAGLSNRRRQLPLSGPLCRVVSAVQTLGLNPPPRGARERRDVTPGIELGRAGRRRALAQECRPIRTPTRKDARLRTRGSRPIRTFRLTDRPGQAMTEYGHLSRPADESFDGCVGSQPLGLAIGPFLANFKGHTRLHPTSDLSCFLRWCDCTAAGFGSVRPRRAGLFVVVGNCPLADGPRR
jgi:hypothetical protein